MLELNKIHCGDCLELMKQIDDSSIDLILTDPPYGINKSFENDNLNDEEFIKFLTDALIQMKRVIKPKHPIIVFFDAGKKLPILFKSVINSGLFYQKMGLWHKPNDCCMPHNRILRKSETFSVLSSTPELHCEGEAYISDCIIQNHNDHYDRHDRTNDNSFYHPTVKNIIVMQKLIESHSLKNDIILDPFIGSGTTGIACKMLNRNFVGIEINPEYVAISEMRIKRYSNQMKIEF